MCGGAEGIEVEVLDLRNQTARYRTDRAAWERSVRASIRRDYEDHFRYYARHALADQLRDVGWRLVQHVEVLPDRPTAAQIERLRWVAKTTSAALISSTPNAGYIDQLVDEIARLRALISEFAQGHHWKAGPVQGERCECEGCELLRAMDDTDVEKGDSL